jgi:translation initiation factor 1A
MTVRGSVTDSLGKNRVVKTGVEERTRTTMRRENSHSRRRVRVRDRNRDLRAADTHVTRSLTSASPTEYAQVLKMLGNGRLEALCFDGSKRLAHIRGKLRKKVWINQGDIILLSLRDYQDEKGDVILKYSADEARSLKAYGELPESAKINETDTYGGEEEGGIGFDFGEDDDSGSGDDIDVDDI